MKKNMQFMMPKAKHALSMEHVLSSETLSPLMVAEPKMPKLISKGVASLDVSAVGVRDKPQVINTGDECADEAEVDEADELRIAAASVVAEEGEERPDQSQDGNDEEGIRI